MTDSHIQSFHDHRGATSADGRPDCEPGLRALLDKVPLGIIAIDGSGRVKFCNSTAPEILGLDPQDKFDRASFTELVLKAGLVVKPVAGSETIVETATTDGRTLEIDATPIGSDGIVLIIEDVTTRRQDEREKQQTAAEYRSLFENAVCGIYRDTFDGEPVRCNAALAQLNGYATEAEFVEAVKAKPIRWYVDPSRREEFMRRMHADGGVRDFVSEGYRHRTGEPYWLMENAWFVRDEQGKPLYIEGTIQDATERMLALGAAERQANHDMLTGAMSRFRFFTELDRLTSPDSKGCTLFAIDLDHFKDVNDMLGHEGGDTVLKEVARRLRELCSNFGTLARIGGDEFAITVPAAIDETQASAFGRKIVSAVDEIFDVGGRAVSMGVSVGAAIYPDLAVNCDELLGNADKALYTAKANGRNGHCVFGAQMRRDTHARKILTRDLSHALAREELELYYQPIIYSDTGMVEGLEALLRWNHPERGLLLPRDFLPVAEEEGLMAEIGTWVLDRACRQAAALPGHIQVSVNISADLFRSPKILDTVRESLARSGLPAKRLALEITENVILSSETLAARVIGRLSDMGVAIALDDFGTAYSSLSYLQKFSFTKVKIDKSFVMGMFDIPANMAVVRAIVGIGRDLGIEVVAEGVEDRMQVERLMREGCRRMQGFYFSKPKPFLEIASELALSQLKPVLDDDDEGSSLLYRRR